MLIVLCAVIAAALVLWSVAALTGDTFLGALDKLFNRGFMPSLGATATLAGVLLFGFLSSFHCIGMCGGLIISVSAGTDDKGRVAGRNLSYHATRVAACTAIGAGVGAIGSFLILNRFILALLPLVCGIILSVQGLKMLGLLRFLSVGASPAGLPARVQRQLGKGSAPVAGLLTALLPCGVLQMAQILALNSGSPVQGALIMLAFSLGTVPVLFGFGMAAGTLTIVDRQWFLRIAAVIVLYFAVKMTIKGVGLL